MIIIIVIIIFDHSLQFVFASPVVKEEKQNVNQSTKAPLETEENGQCREVWVYYMAGYWSKQEEDWAGSFQFPLIFFNRSPAHILTAWNRLFEG